MKNKPYLLRSSSMPVAPPDLARLRFKRDRVTASQSPERNSSAINHYNSASPQLRSKAIPEIYEKDQPTSPLAEGDEEQLPIKVRKTEAGNKNAWRFLPENIQDVLKARPELRKELDLPTHVGGNDLEHDQVKEDGGFHLKDLGGLDEQINAVIESIVLPLKHPEVCRSLNILPTKGFLFHGPPGTGKTSLARALAQDLNSTLDTTIAYFQFTSSDILSKHVGESESKLTAIFRAAHHFQPSIMFFDEIDGLLPARVDSDRPSASLVATFLQLMDGLIDMGQIIIIGSTNRLAALDDAVRRPGRFDEELHFPFPNLQARHTILKLIIQGWQHPPPQSILYDLALRSPGFSGADLKALCSRAAVNALLRQYPNALEVGQSPPGIIEPQTKDFLDALPTITPSAHRTLGFLTKPLPDPESYLLQHKVRKSIDLISQWGSQFENNSNQGGVLDLPRVILLHATDPIAAHHVLCATLQGLEEFHVIDLDPYAACSVSDRTGARHIQSQLNSSLKKADKGLFLIRDAMTYFEDCSPRITALIKIAFSTPSPRGKVTFLITSTHPDLTQHFQLPEGGNTTIMGLDRIPPTNLRPYCTAILDQKFGTGALNTGEQRSGLVQSDDHNLDESEDEDAREEAIDVLERELRGKTLSQIIDTVANIPFNRFISFADFIISYQPSPESTRQDGLNYDGGGGLEAF